MKTWAKQLEEALPNATERVYETIMDGFCPFHVFADEFAPVLQPYEVSEEDTCEKCWDSCESKCWYGRGEKE